MAEKQNLFATVRSVTKPSTQAGSNGSNKGKGKVKQSRYRPGQPQRVLGS